MGMLPRRAFPSAISFERYRRLITFPDVESYAQTQGVRFYPVCSAIRHTHCIGQNPTDFDVTSEQDADAIRAQNRDERERDLAETLSIWGNSPALRLSQI